MPEYPHMQKSLDTITHISADLLGLRLRRLSPGMSRYALARPCHRNSQRA
jgi:hypothetical protein